MFGKRKKKAYVEKNMEIFSQVAEKSEGFDAEFTRIEEESKLVRRDVLQLMEYTKKITEYAKTNIETEKELLDSANEFADFFQKNQENYEMLKELIGNLLETSTFLVEENKHYTTPAKYLSTIPELLRNQSCSYEAHFEEMVKFGKQINVLALNSAIEAGRMGEQGRKFVDVAEEIRRTVLSFEKETLLLKEEIMESQKQIVELEKTIQQLIKRMKNNNKGTAKLFKKCQDTIEKAETISFCGFSGKMEQFRENLEGVHMQEKELFKSSEKCQMQLNEIGELLKGQKYAVSALANDVSYVFGLAREQSEES